jgi:hypothetical protein
VVIFFVGFGRGVWIWLIENKTRRERMSGRTRGKVWPMGHWRVEPEKESNLSRLKR